MRYELSDNLILEINDLIKSFNLRYVYCGSISLYLNGMKDIITDFEDVDVDFIDCNEEEKTHINLGLIFGIYPIDMVHPIIDHPLRYHKINFHGEEIFISDLDYELETKQLFITNPTYYYKEKAEQRIQQIQNYLTSQNEAR